MFRRADLLAIGVDPSLTATMVRRGWWVRLHHGVYTDAETLEAAMDDRSRHLLSCLAAIRALPEPAFAFAVTSALVHSLPVDRDASGTVTVVRDLGADQRALTRRITTGTRLTDIRVHSHRLSAADLTVVNSIPTVSRDVAAVSTACQCSDEWAVVILDAAAWQRPEAVSRLATVAEDWPRLRGIGTVRRALPHVRSGAQTPLETISRLRLMACGLPEPRLQVPLFDADGLIGYADMGWDQWRVVGEADGRVKYETRDDLIAEKRREDRIRAAGYGVVRWDWREIHSAPDRVAERVRAAARSQRRAGPGEIARIDVPRADPAR